MTQSIPDVQRFTEEAIESARSTTSEGTSVSGESEELIRYRLNLETPYITRLFGQGDTLSVSIMGIIAIALVAVCLISLACDVEKTKILALPLTTVIGYLAGKKLH